MDNHLTWTVSVIDAALPLPGPEACWGCLGPPALDHQIPGEIAHIYTARDRHFGARL